jgi:hypothetical protein
MTRMMTRTLTTMTTTWADRVGADGGYLATMLPAPSGTLTAGRKGSWGSEAAGERKATGTSGA